MSDKPEKKLTKARLLKEFFVRGRDITLPDGRKGRFVRYTTGNKQFSWVSTAQGLSVVPTEGLIDRNLKTQIQEMVRK